MYGNVSPLFGAPDPRSTPNTNITISNTISNTNQQLYTTPQVPSQPQQQQSQWMAPLQQVPVLPQQQQQQQQIPLFPQQQQYQQQQMYPPTQQLSQIQPLGLPNSQQQQQQWVCTAQQIPGGTSFLPQVSQHSYAVQPQQPLISTAFQQQQYPVQQSQQLLSGPVSVSLPPQAQQQQLSSFTACSACSSHQLDPLAQFTNSQSANAHTGTNTNTSPQSQEYDPQDHFQHRLDPSTTRGVATQTAAPTPTPLSTGKSVYASQSSSNILPRDISDLINHKASFKLLNFSSRKSATRHPHQDYVLLSKTGIKNVFMNKENRQFLQSHVKGGKLPETITGTIKNIHMTNANPSNRYGLLAGTPMYIAEVHIDVHSHSHH
ncbi:hypothetical protein Pelo_7164 [Pelomyxa schiedti]|nr:hypothetical protein Pelo_7164 [Pelomyxa schiedti]